MTTEFDRAVDRLLNHVSHWTPSRWAASSESGTGSRADVMYELLQRLADLVADAEGLPHRPVPRLDNLLGLPDQLRVIAADLRVMNPDEATLAAATELVRATAP